MAFFTRFLSIQSLLKVLAVFICSTCFWANGIRAQGDIGWPEWQQVCGGPLGPGWTAIYFIDPLHGVTAVNGSIFYTYLGQHQWRGSAMPSGIGSIKAIRFIQGKLYAATQGSDVLVSVDSGLSWQFSGLNLPNANDVYADGAGTIRALRNPMKVFARLDTLHCIAQGTGNIFVSSDGGLTWVSSGVSMVDSFSTGAFADPCEHIYLCPNSWGTAFRSTDTGKTWKTVITGSGPGSEFVYGASTVPYITDTTGLFRSIDDGLTWKSIITVNSGPHIMYVWGPMGEHAAISWLSDNPNPHSTETGIWMTTTGGDDFLHSGVNMTDSNGAPLLQNDTFSVPLMLTSMCNAYSIGVPFLANVEGISESVSILSGNAGDFTLLGQTSVTLPSFGHDTLWVAYTPHHAIDTVVLQFDNHWHCSDWSETRTVIVVSYPEAQIVPPPPLGGNCKPVSEAALVKIDSCSTLVIDSVYIPAEISSRLTFDAPLPDTIRAGLNDSLFFTFDPSDTFATILDSVEILAHFPGMDSALSYWDYRWNLGNELPPYPSLTNIDQFLPLKMVALPGVALFSEDTEISFQRASFCETTLDTIVKYKNEGCTADTISEVSLSGTGYTMPAASLPIFVQPDSTISFTLNFAAPDTGMFQGSLQLQVSSGDTRTLSIPLSGAGFPHWGILSMPANSIDAGSFSICAGDTIVTDTISNIGCDTLAITNMRLAGDTDFTIVSPIADSLIPPGSVLIVSVHFKPFAKDSRRASVTFHSANISGGDPGQDATFTLQGAGFRGTALLSANVATLDVGQTFICEERDTFAVIQNIGCDTVCVSNIFVSPSNFIVTSGSGSFCLVPGAYDTIWLHTQIDTTGGVLANNDSLNVISDADSALTPIALSREIVYPSPWALSISAPDSCYAGGSIVYKIIQHGSLSPDVTGVDLQVVFNGDMLTLNSIDEPNVSWPPGYYRDGAGFAHYILHISPVGTDSVLATLHLSAYQTIAETTPITPDSVQINSTVNLLTNCVTNLTLSSSTFSIRYSCGGPLFSDALSGNLFNFSIDPNPAMEIAQAHYFIGLSAPASATVFMEDALGRIVSEKPVLLAPGGGNSIPLDLGGLPAGVYCVRIAMLGESATARLVKE